MTTRITIDAHAGWDVEVVVEELDDSGNVVKTFTEIVLKHTVADYCIHSNKRLTSIKEVKQT